MWLNNLPVPKEICDANPVLRDYGIYRELNNGKKEFVSVCTKEITLYLSIYGDDFNNLLDKYVPKK